MTRRAHVLAGLSLIALMVLALDQPAMAVLVRVVAGVAALMLALAWHLGGLPREREG